MKQKGRGSFCLLQSSSLATPCHYFLSYYYPLPWRAINVREVVCFFSTLSSTFFTAARKSTTYNFRQTNYVGSFTFYDQIPLFVIWVTLCGLISWYFCRVGFKWLQIRSSTFDQYVFSKVQMMTCVCLCVSFSVPPLSDRKELVWLAGTHPPTRINPWNEFGSRLIFSNHNVCQKTFRLIFN